MKIGINTFHSLVKSRTEKIDCLGGIFYSRSAILSKIKGEKRTLFGFGMAKTESESLKKSRFELLERMSFFSDSYSETELNSPVLSSTQVTSSSINNYMFGKVIADYPLGANGCAIANERSSAIRHACNELFERHMCCLFWYQKGEIRLAKQDKFQITLQHYTAIVEVYGQNIPRLGYFAIVSLNGMDNGFFCLGSSIRKVKELAIEHATYEAIMLFYDAVSRRSHPSGSTEALNNILSLRDPNQSRDRKKHFRKLLSQQKLTVIQTEIPNPDWILFEPIRGLYAARAFSEKVLEPKRLLKSEKLPTMPLF